MSEFYSLVDRLLLEGLFGTCFVSHLAHRAA